jgi:hypothetical protein
MLEKQHQVKHKDEALTLPSFSQLPQPSLISYQPKTAVSQTTDSDSQETDHHDGPSAVGSANAEHPIEEVLVHALPLLELHHLG